MTSPYRYDQHPTPRRWKGLNEPCIPRPQAEPRDSSLDALEYAAMRIPKGKNTYIVPPLREDYHASPSFSSLQPPVKKNRVEEEVVGTVPKRPRDNRKYVKITSPPHDSDEKQPPLKRVRDGSLEEVTKAMENITTQDTEDVATEAVTEKGVEIVTSQEESEELGDNKSVSGTPVVDSTLMTFESLTCNRLKELCNEYDIAIPKGSKKKPVFVALLMEEFPSPLNIMEQESLESFMKEALETKCCNLGIPDTGSKSKLVHRLEAHLAGDKA
jgi:hypothetical protein